MLFCMQWYNTRVRTHLKCKIWFSLQVTVTQLLRVADAKARWAKQSLFGLASSGYLFTSTSGYLFTSTWLRPRIWHVSSLQIFASPTLLDTHSPGWFIFDFWKIKLEKLSLTNWLFSLQKSILKLIFAAYTGSKNPVWNRLKMQFVELDFSKLIFQKSKGERVSDQRVLKLTLAKGISWIGSKVGIVWNYSVKSHLSRK